MSATDTHVSKHVISMCTCSAASMRQPSSAWCKNFINYSYKLSWFFITFFSNLHFHRWEHFGNSEQIHWKYLMKLMQGTTWYCFNMFKKLT